MYSTPKNTPDITVKTAVTFASTLMVRCRPQNANYDVGNTRHELSFQRPLIIGGLAESARGYLTKYPIYARIISSGANA